MLASWGFRKETAAPSQACTPRPKGSRRNEPAQLATAAKPPARWLTYLGLITAFITAVVSQSMTTAEIEQAIQLYQQGHSLAAVGAKLGYDHGTIHQALKRAGIPRRDSHGRER